MAEVNSVGDTNIDRRVPVSGMPLSPSEYNYIVLPLPGSSTSTLTITTNTAVKELSLFNWAFTIYVDVDGSADYEYPTGDALTSSQRSFVVMNWQDWYASDSLTNKKVYKIIAYNNNAASKTLYIYYKPFTFSYVTGSSS